MEVAQAASRQLNLAGQGDSGEQGVAQIDVAAVGAAGGCQESRPLDGEGVERHKLLLDQLIEEGLHALQRKAPAALIRMDLSDVSLIEHCTTAGSGCFCIKAETTLVSSRITDPGGRPGAPHLAIRGSVELQGGIGKECRDG